MIAGPCAVESRDQLLTTARTCASRRRRCCAAAPSSRAPRPTPSRGWARRACGCSPRREAETGLPIVTEVMDARDVDAGARGTPTCIQIGARNMQNYPLLAEIGRAGTPVAAQARHVGDDRGAADGGRVHAQAQGNPNVILCERGIRTFETAYRNTLDLNAVPVLKELTHLPVIVDPSHAAGRRDLVPPLALAAAAAARMG